MIYKQEDICLGFAFIQLEPTARFIQKVELPEMKLFSSDEKFLAPSSCVILSLIVIVRG